MTSLSLDLIDKKNKKISELESTILELNNSTMVLGVAYLRTRKLLDRAMKDCSDEKLLADYKALIQDAVSEAYKEIKIG